MVQCCLGWVKINLGFMDAPNSLKIAISSGSVNESLSALFPHLVLQQRTHDTMKSTDILIG